MLTIKYTNLRGGTAPGRASACISQGKGGRDLKLSTARAHLPIRIFIPQRLQLHAPLTVVPTYPFTSFTFATAVDVTNLRGGRYRWARRKPPIHIILPQSPASRAANGHAYVSPSRRSPLPSPRLLVKVEASNNHQYSMYFLGKVGGA